jgi:hypothetical protein
MRRRTLSSIQHMRLFCIRLSPPLSTSKPDDAQCVRTFHSMAAAEPDQRRLPCSEQNTKGSDHSSQRPSASSSCGCENSRDLANHSQAFLSPSTSLRRVSARSAPICYPCEAAADADALKTYLSMDCIACRCNMHGHSRFVRLQKQRRWTCSRLLASCTVTCILDQEVESIFNGSANGC